MLTPQDKQYVEELTSRQRDIAPLIQQAKVGPDSPEWQEYFEIEKKLDAVDTRDRLDNYQWLAIHHCVIRPMPETRTVRLSIDPFTGPTYEANTLHEAVTLAWQDWLDKQLPGGTE